MNYRHAYHAGNFADVVKHTVLALVIAHLKRKDAPFRLIDCHAGIGLYDLAADEAQRTGEWRAGIARLLGPDAAPLPPAVAAALAPYLDTVQAANGDGGLRWYPGSPWIAAHMLRGGDRMLLCELHGEDHATLAATMRRDRRAKVLNIDGWIGLKAFLPPKERRGLVLVDPPFEKRDDLTRMVEGLEHAVRRWATGTYLLWYPIKDAGQTRAFTDAVRQVSVDSVLQVELMTRKTSSPLYLSGCGLVIVNPPYTLHAALQTILPDLSGRLTLEPGAGCVLRWLKEK